VIGLTERMVIVGGDAAGMSAASQAKRLAGDTLQVLAFERGAHSSYSACGIPYWVAGDVDDGEQLVARTPEAHRANGALHNPGCSSGLKPPVSSSDLAM
jgi:NADPH-dependent 2,4-dienoyl-CoA reductase/sulfur reductase-like enzyme